MLFSEDVRGIRNGSSSLKGSPRLRALAGKALCIYMDYLPILNIYFSSAFALRKSGGTVFER